MNKHVNKRMQSAVLKRNWKEMCNVHYMEILKAG